MEHGFSSTVSTTVEARSVDGTRGGRSSKYWYQTRRHPSPYPGGSGPRGGPSPTVKTPVDTPRPSVVSGVDRVPRNDRPLLDPSFGCRRWCRTEGTGLREVDRVEGVPRPPRVKDSSTSLPLSRPIIFCLLDDVQQDSGIVYE